MFSELDESPLRIGGVDIFPRERVTIDLPIANLYTHGQVHMPVKVLRGAKAGPVLLLCAAIHGDEINGVEIIHRVMRSRVLAKLRGSVIAVPVVNVFGFLAHSRYLPDRRDLNRSFPGSESGSLAARMARLFLDEVLAHATHGIDLHTGAIHRSNLPQVRATLAQPGVEELAHAFDAPVIVDAELRDGSLRAAAGERGVPMIVYEAGEALRFDPVATRAGYRGVLHVMRALGMLPPPAKPTRKIEPIVARSTSWVRAADSGVLRLETRLGRRVQRSQVLGRIGDPFGSQEVDVVAPFDGIVIGHTQIPLVNEGDALFHIAQFESGAPVERTLEAFQREFDVPWSFDPTEGGT